MFKAKIPLIGVVFEFALEHTCVGMSTNDCHGFISAETVNDDHVFRPGKTLQRAPDIGRLVEGQDDWRNPVKHLEVLRSAQGRAVHPAIACLYALSI